MKVGILLASFGRTGVETTMLRLANGLAAIGVDVDVVVMDGSLKGVQYLLQSDIRTVDLGARRLWNSLPAIVRYIRRERPVAIIAAAPLANGLAGIAKLVSGYSVVTVLTEHGLRLFGFADGGTLRRRLLKLVLSAGYKRADALVGVSRGVAAQLADRFASDVPRIEMIYNPIWSREMEAAAEIAPEHPWFTDVSRVPVVVAVGRLADEKGFDVLLQAMFLVTQQRNARLIILGEGEARGALERRVGELGLSSVVAMPGFANNPLGYMRAASVLALSSWSEALPTVIVEALACGTPVVSTDCPTGPREILGDGEFGTLVPVGDAEALAEGILRALGTSADRGRLQARARDFSVEAAAAEYVDLINRIRAKA